jgi:hypothetical protein
MKRCLPLALLALSVSFALVSCVAESEKKPVGPTSETSNMPWNTPVAGQGQGQFGMMQQNQYRR